MYPSLILLSETRTTSDIQTYEIDINNYHVLRCDSYSRHTGGVVMYIKHGVEYSGIKHNVKEGNYWCMFINVWLNNIKWKIGVLYRSPSGSIAEFLEDFEIWCEMLSSKNQKFVFVGDFNINFNEDSFYCNKLKNLITTFGFEQIINEGTRCVDVSNTLIDLVITNYSTVKCIVHDTPKITDHSLITVKMLARYIQNSNNKKKVFRNFSDSNMNKICLELIQQNWPLNSINVNDIYSKMLSNCETVINMISPIQTIENKYDSLPWYDKEIKNKSKERDAAYKHFKNCDDNNEKPRLWEIFKLKRNEVVNMLKVKKDKYYEQKIDTYSNNSKLMWKTLKTLIKPKHYQFKENTVRFEINNSLTVANTNEEIAAGFNNYFIASITEITNSIPSVYQWSSSSYEVKECNFNEFSLLTLSDLKTILLSLDNKYSSSCILNSKVLKTIFQTIGHVILHFVNTSLSKGQFPDELKTSTVIPVPKIENSNQACDFRPINTLPPLEKILELAVYNQISAYFDKNNLLIGNQSGFRIKHSCETALQLTIANWNNKIDNDQYVVAVFLDFKRAFETIDRNILIEKFKYYGMGGSVLEWFKNYLTNRSQCTKINDTVSSSMLVNVGVPQGSVLGPLLFIIYLNDINLSVNCDFINLFADDTLISISDSNVNVAIDKMNRELIKLSEYLNTNKLKLNLNKTKAMICTKRYNYSKLIINNINICFNNNKLELVTEIKYLGFIISNDLSLKNHFVYVQKKISKKLFFFSRVSQFLSVATNITVYKTIIQPHFDYCASILNFLDNNSIAILQKLQNRGMRIILKCNRFTPIKSMLNVLEWLSVKQRLKYFTLVFVFKILNGLCPSYFCNYIVYNYQIHNHLTRSNNHLHIERKNSIKFMHTLFADGFREYNLLPNKIKESISLNVFKKHLLQYIRSNS